MEEWKTDQQFLDFLLTTFEREGNEKFAPLLGSGRKTYSFVDLVEEMKEGTRMGKRLYNTLYEAYREEFASQQEK